jgi:hypothetical protein
VDLLESEKASGDRLRVCRHRRFEHRIACFDPRAWAVPALQCLHPVVPFSAARSEAPLVVEEEWSAGWARQASAFWSRGRRSTVWDRLPARWAPIRSVWGAAGRVQRGYMRCGSGSNAFSRGPDEVDRVPGGSALIRSGRGSVEGAGRRSGPSGSPIAIRRERADLDPQRAIDRATTRVEPTLSPHGLVSGLGGRSAASASSEIAREERRVHLPRLPEARGLDVVDHHVEAIRDGAPGETRPRRADDPRRAVHRGTRAQPEWLAASRRAPRRRRLVHDGKRAFTATRVDPRAALLGYEPGEGHPRFVARSAATTLHI